MGRAVFAGSLRKAVEKATVGPNEKEPQMAGSLARSPWALLCKVTSLQGGSFRPREVGQQRGKRNSDSEFPTHL